MSRIEVKPDGKKGFMILVNCMKYGTSLSSCALANKTAHDIKKTIYPSFEVIPMAVQG